MCITIDPIANIIHPGDNCQDYLIIMSQLDQIIWQFCFWSDNAIFIFAQYFSLSTNPFNNDGQTFGAKKQVKTLIAISKEFWYFMLLHNTTTSQQIVISCASDQFHICLCSLENVVHFYSFIVNDRSQFSMECRAISYLATRIINRI